MGLTIATTSSVITLEVSHTANEHMPNSTQSKHIVHQPLSITREHREQLNRHKGKVIWFTGLSGSGKSTLANALEEALHRKNYRTFILDGDNIRHGLNKDLGFSNEDRVENIRRIAEVAKLMMDAGLVVITAFISPFKEDRRLAKELIGSKNFLEVYLDTPIEICEGRDIKGLYKKARLGQLKNMTGIDSPYEAPVSPDIIINASEEIIKSVERLVKFVTK